MPICQEQQKSYKNYAEKAEIESVWIKSLKWQQAIYRVRQKNIDNISTYRNIVDHFNL